MREINKEYTKKKFQIYEKSNSLSKHLRLMHVISYLNVMNSRLFYCIHLEINDNRIFILKLINFKVLDIKINSS